MWDFILLMFFVLDRLLLLLDQGCFNQTKVPLTLPSTAIFNDERPKLICLVGC